MAARLVGLAGCSNYFLGSIVAYSNSAKEKLLGVEGETLEKYGAVSSQTAAQMALGALNALGSDVSLAVTGVAGPDGGTASAPVGTLWGAIASRKKEPLVWHFHLEGSRQEIIETAVEILLSRFWQYLQEYR